jgi:hypothetical protein
MANYLGALPFFVGAAGLPRYGGALSQAALQRSNRMAGFVRPDMAGVPSRDGAMLPMAFPPFAFALATGTNIITQSANPQTPFRGQRLVSQVIRNGTSAALTAPVVQQFLVGQKPIIVTGSGVPIETFSQNAFDTNLMLPPTVPGVNYTMNMSLTAALTTTDTILTLVTIIGSALL